MASISRLLHSNCLDNLTLPPASHSADRAGAEESRLHTRSAPTFPAISSHPSLLGLDCAFRSDSLSVDSNSCISVCLFLSYSCSLF